MPTLRADCVASAYLYFDAHADDARLTLAIARTAAEHGAVVVNHAPAVGIVEGRRRAACRACTVDADGDRASTSRRASS